MEEFAVKESYCSMNMYVNKLHIYFLRGRNSHMKSDGIRRKLNTIMQTEKSNAVGGDANLPLNCLGQYALTFKYPSYISIWRL